MTLARISCVHLIMSSLDSLDQLESWVKELFCAVPRRSHHSLFFLRLKLRYFLALCDGGEGTFFMP